MRNKKWFVICLVILLIVLFIILMYIAFGVVSNNSTTYEEYTDSIKENVVEMQSNEELFDIQIKDEVTTRCNDFLSTITDELEEYGCTEFYVESASYGATAKFVAATLPTIYDWDVNVFIEYDDSFHVISYEIVNDNDAS